MKHLEPFFSFTNAFPGLGRCSNAFVMPFMTLPWCFSVLFSDGCVLQHSRNLRFSSCSGVKTSQVSPAQEKTLSADTPEKVK